MINWFSKIENIKTESEFNGLTIEAFNYQYKNVLVYQEYCDYLKIKPNTINQYKQIPFIPIEFFKSKQLIDKTKETEVIFNSSGTTGTITSQHFVANSNIYTQSFLTAFRRFYGNIEEYCVLALLPSYIERGGSSLVYMAQTLIEKCNHPDSGFYLNNYKELSTKLKELNKKNQKILLLGVSYALLDMAEQFPIQLNNTIIMETGGMKGRRKELIREELHTTLCNGFGVDTIHSEYGMTELLSQAYSKGKGIFSSPPWMKVLIRDTYDPFFYMNKDRSGGINVIDLANIYSCCFIETKDLGKTIGDHLFTIIGRFDNSDIRGCNLMVE